MYSGTAVAVTARGGMHGANRPVRNLCHEKERPARSELPCDEEPRVGHGSEDSRVRHLNRTEAWHDSRSSIDVGEARSRQQRLDLSGCREVPPPALDG